MTVLEAIVLVLKIAFEIVKAILAANSAARAKKEKFELDQSKFRVIAQEVLERILNQARRKADDSRKVEDDVDRAVPPDSWGKP